MDAGAGFSARLALNIPSPQPSPAGRGGNRALYLSLLLALIACLPLWGERATPVYRHIAVVDITRSMNVADYRHDGRTLSRLDFVKLALRQALVELPCGSRFGLAVFTERQAALLFEPVETCAGHAAIAEAIERLDWRQAWAADSRIADGLYRTLEILQAYPAQILFFTDGQEAPPANPRYRPDFSRIKGRMKGALVGVGGLQPAPIPKFDEQGRSLGFVGPEEVPHRSTFGLPEAPEQVEGYHARNAPFGAEAVMGNEHLSALREDYLRQLGGDSGLGYARLGAPEDLTALMMRPEFAETEPAPADLRPVPAILALLALLLAYRLAGAS